MNKLKKIVQKAQSKGSQKVQPIFGKSIDYKSTAFSIPEPTSPELLENQKNSKRRKDIFRFCLPLCNNVIDICSPSFSF